MDLENKFCGFGVVSNIIFGRQKAFRCYLFRKVISSQNKGTAYCN